MGINGERINMENNLLKDANLIKQTGDISKAFDVDNRQRTVSIGVLVFMIFAAFFISLADASWDWRAIGTAKFWVDFTITFGGGQFLKYVWGKFGFFEGYKNEEVKEQMTVLSLNNKSIIEKGLVSKLKDFIADTNDLRKFKAFRDKVYKEALRRPKSKYWQEQKETIRIQEQLFKETDPEKQEELQRELEDRNFDLSTLEIYKFSLFGAIPRKLKYSKIKEGAIGTGYEDTDKDDEDSMEFSEMYQLYGKNAMFTIATTGISFLVSLVGFSAQDMSMAVWATFLSRIFVYILNSYVGFSIGLSSIETVKLNILKRINNFLATFIEANKNYVAQEVSKNVQ